MSKLEAWWLANVSLAFYIFYGSGKEKFVFYFPAVLFVLGVQCY